MATQSVNGTVVLGVLAGAVIAAAAVAGGSVVLKNELNSVEPYVVLQDPR